jgi:hypothetical protein
MNYAMGENVAIGERLSGVAEEWRKPRYDADRLCQAFCRRSEDLSFQDRGVGEKRHDRPRNLWSIRSWVLASVTSTRASGSGSDLC